MDVIRTKRVFVTGGAKGIGRAIVIAFCQAGADVTFCDVDEVSALALCDEMKNYQCRYLMVDVGNKDSLQNAVSAVLVEKGDIDILINNTGVSRFGSIHEVSVEEFDKVLNINLRSVFITAKLLAEHRSKEGKADSYGRIINIASTRYLMSEPNSEAYAASKGGVVSLTHALAVSLSEYKITVNCISPGWIETGNYNSLKAADHEQHPSGRVGVPSDIARACLFLCNPDNDFINGQNIVIDGGMTKKMIYAD